MKLIGFPRGLPWNRTGQGRAGSFAIALPWAISLLWAVALGAADAAAAPSSSWERTDFSSVRLISATTGTGNAKEVFLGLHFRMNKDWKIYWRSPGDAGYPPQVDWSGSDNLSAAKLSWPAPKRFSVIGLETLGYKDEVVLPITATLVDGARPLALKATVGYLICSEICIPVEATLRLSLDAGAAEPSPFAHLISRYDARVPRGDGAQGITIEAAQIAASGKFLRITARADAPFSSPDIYVEGPPELVFSKPRVSFGEQGKLAVLDVPLFGMEDLNSGLIGASLTLTLIDEPRMSERRLQVAALTPNGGLASDTTNTQTNTPSGRPLWLILALAVLGGLILNLMPCVLPVLSIKLMGAISHGGGERRTVRLSFLASAAGILVSFLVLASALLALKMSGAAIGWGIQFQQPLFLVAMTLMVTLFACNLWGFFEFRLPYGVSDLGEKTSHVHGLGGNFLSGAAATLLATPCSAPFLGTAVGFALARGAGEIYAVFTALGVGLALPYLLVALRPGLATRLPRPGPWMEVLRRILGFALAATGLWLLYVLEAQAGRTAAIGVGLLMTGAGLMLYLRHRHPSALPRITVAAAAVIALAAFAVPGGLIPLPPPAVTAKDDPVKGMWGAFDQAAIPALVAGGKTVFVDVTADWCITCQVNKAVAFSEDRVLSRFKSGEVVTMQADWTRPSDEIARYLASFGRYGIPFNVVYGPGAPEGVVLPELLSPGAVLAGLEKARGNGKILSTR